MVSPSESFALPDAGPPKARNRAGTRRWLALVLAVGLAVVLVLAILPLRSVSSTTVQGFQLTTEWPGTDYSYTVNHLPAYAFCDPPSSERAGVLSFTWQVVAQNPVNQFVVAQFQGSNAIWLYEASNVSSGRYSVATPLFVCQQPVFFTMTSSPVETATVTGGFTYNSSEAVPIL